MYEYLKKKVKRVLPSQLLWRVEPMLRKLIFQFYRGKGCYCNLCDKQFSRFIRLSSKELLCPSCGSLPRNRRLWLLLTKDGNFKGKVLHFSPSRVLYRKFKSQPDIEYNSSDFENEFLADLKFDITSIDVPDGQFDLVVCYHVLEHIDEDQLAMAELYRVLKPGGTALLQTPFKDGAIYENEDITDPEGRLLHFGQEDHVRIYSVNGLSNRLAGVGFRVEVRTFPETEEDKRMGLKSGETVLMAYKKES